MTMTPNNAKHENETTEGQQKTSLTRLMRWRTKSQWWTGCRWAKGQPRFLLDNKFDEAPDIDHHKLTEHGFATVTHVAFMLIIDPAWPEKMTNADKMAVLKRSHFIAQTNKHLFIR